MFCLIMFPVMCSFITSVIQLALVKNKSISLISSEIILKKIKSKQNVLFDEKHNASKYNVKVMSAKIEQMV